MSRPFNRDHSLTGIHKDDGRSRQRPLKTAFPSNPVQVGVCAMLRSSCLLKYSCWLNRGVSHVPGKPAVTLKRSWHSLKACTWPQSKHEHLPIEHDRAGEKEEGIHCVTSVIGSRPALALGCSAEVAFRFHSDIRKAIMAYWKARFRASAAVRTPRDARLKMGTWRKFVQVTLQQQ